jgi:hypothetical protein
MRRTMLHLAAATLLALTLAACGSDDGDTTAGDDTSAETTAPNGGDTNGDDDGDSSGDDVLRVGSISSDLDCATLVTLAQELVGTPGNGFIRDKSGGGTCSAGGGGTGSGIVLDGVPDGGVDVTVNTVAYSDDSPIEYIRDKSFGKTGISADFPMDETEAPEGWTFAGSTNSAEQGASWYGLFVLSEDNVVLGCTVKLSSYVENPVPPTIDTAKVAELCNKVKESVVTE